MEQTRLKYPLGRQDFRNLRTRGYAYADKTERICEVLDGGYYYYYYYYARPRRLRKPRIGAPGLELSLRSRPCGEFYSRHCDLFEGLWAYD